MPTSLNMISLFAEEDFMDDSNFWKGESMILSSLEFSHSPNFEVGQMDVDGPAVAEEINTYCQKRGRGRPRLYLDPKVPRVFKHDLRRQYPTMLLNTMNSCDYGTFLSFFQVFALPEMIVCKKPISLEEIKKLPPGMSLPPLPIVPFRGSDWVQFHFLQASCFCADRVFQIEDAKIITRSDTQSSVIVMNVVNELTYLYAVDPITMIDAMLGLQIHPIPEDAEPLPERTYLSSNINQTFIRQNTNRERSHEFSIADLHAFYCQQTGEFGIPLLCEPERVTIRTQLSLFLTPSKHIERMEIGDGKLSHAVGPTPRLWSKVRHLRWRSNCN
mmetsp:Transcript_6329/g.4767  ORF Transcript_6329/g.4767 Transcript_6329/m.4767 type:complete len:329 (-) Transcript_6329:118-1104(-)